jgi:outer membrane receptor protein involved in Fe transport
VEALGGQPGRESLATSPTANVAFGSEALGRAATDAGSLINRSESVVGVEAQKRSPIATETRVRGQHLGQVQTWADGAYWFPARQDLDTFLSKIDSGIVRNIVVLKGPYSALYGPGLSFIDIATNPSPRYKEGFEWHGRTVFEYKNAGQQLYGRQTVLAGSNDWGVRLSYGQRTGNDYFTGADVDVPASFNSRDIDFVYGTDLSCNSHLEFGYLRLDQTGLEFPGQIFDTDALVTNGFRTRYTLENQEMFDLFAITAWYNETRLHGDAQHTGKRYQIPVLGPINPQGQVLGGVNFFPTVGFVPGLGLGQVPSLGFSGLTAIDQESWGYRSAFTWGKAKEAQLTVGTDFRYLSQALNELDTLFQLALPCGNVFNFPIPRSYQATVGLFAEYVKPVNDCLLVKMGARGDYVNSNVVGTPAFFACPGMASSNLPSFQDTARAVLGTTDFDRDAGLWLAYATAEYKMDPHVTLLGGLSHGERPPTMTELYAMEPFLAILQQGFTTVRGNPGLSPERLSQFDLGVRADYDRWRAGASAFYAWIDNYITYQAENPTSGVFKLPPTLTNALTVRFVNTDVATLTGFELYGEVDATDYLTPFMNMSYVSGRDHTRDNRGVNPLVAGIPNHNIGANGSTEEPLPGIPPLETRLGIRVHEPYRKNPRWAVELDARMDVRQDRVAESLGEVASAGFVVWNLRAYWQAREGILLTGGVENLFNRNYREHLDLLTGIPFHQGVYQPGSSVYAGVELRY